MCQVGLRKSPLPVAACYLQRQEFNTIRDLLRVQRLCRDFKVLYYLADAQSKLMHIEEAGKLDTLSLKTGSQSEQVRILTEKNSTRFGGPSQTAFRHRVATHRLRSQSEHQYFEWEGRRIWHPLRDDPCIELSSTSCSPLTKLLADG